MSDMLEDYSQESELVGKIMSRFFALPRGRLYVLFVFIIVVWYIAKATIISLFFKCMSILCFCFKKDKNDLMNEDADAVEGAVNSTEIYSRDFYKDLRPRFLLYLYDKAGRELDIVKKEKLTSVQFDSHRYAEEE